MRIGSLFSGAGGLDMAVEEVFGGEVVWQAEVDKAASKVLAYRFPCAPNLGDITQIDWKTVEPVDVICGGYPCQPFSQAGQRQGTDDERHLWPYFAEAIRRIRPSYAVLENVAGHRSMGFDSVLADLASSGYDAQWCSVRACDVGAPHRRERLFVLATNTRDRDEPERARPPRREVGQWSSVGSESGQRGDESPVALLPTPNAQDGNGGKAPRGGSNTHNTGTKRQVPLTDLPDLLPTPTTQDGANNAGPSQFQRNTLPLNAEVMLLPTPNASDGSGGGQHPDKREGHSRQLIDYVLAPSQWGKYAPAIARWEQIVGRAPAPTEPNKNGNPRLNPAFSEWMMGWPAGWVTDPDIGISRNDQLKIIGNGVCPQQAIAALRYLLTVSEVAA